MARQRGRAVSSLLGAVLLAGCAGSADSAGDSDPHTVLQVRDVADGRTRWTLDLASQPAPEPVLAGDLVLVAGGEEGAVAYQVSDGAVRWRVPGAPLPAAVADDVAVFELSGRIEGRSLADGRLLWSRPSSGHVVFAREGTGVALFTDLSDPCGAATGSCAATIPLPPTAGEVPALTSEVELLDPASGSPLWRSTLDGRADAGTSSVSTGHVLVSLGTPDAGQVFVKVLDRADGGTSWSATTGEIADTSSSGDVLSVTTGLDASTAQVLDGVTGAVLWEAPGSEFPLDAQAPFVDATADEGFRRDPRTGRTLPGRVPFSYGLAAAGDVLVGAGPGTLTAVRGDRQLWAAPLPDGPRPVTYVDVDEHVVASITSVGQPPTGD